MPATRHQRCTQLDWDAIKRDYRTGRFTDRELSALHKVSRETIVRRRKRDLAENPCDWPCDLSEQVRHATNALLAQESVAQAITASHLQVTDVILSAAELAKQMILGHRHKLRELLVHAEKVRDKALSMTNSIADVREAAAAMSALEGYGRVLKLVIEKERESFKLDDPGTADVAPKRPLESYSPAERTAALLEMLGAG